MNKFIKYSIPLIFLWLILVAKGYAACEWDWISPTPTGVDLHAVTYSDSLDLRAVVGNFGAIITSSDGISWSSQSSGTQAPIDDIVWDGTRFIAVSSTQISLTSTDGNIWSVHSIASTSPADEFEVNDVASNGTLTVAVGSGGKIFSSTDGVNWTLQVSGETDSLADVIWTGTQFVALASSGNILTSTDGLTWAVIGSSTIASNNAAIAWNGTIFVVVGGGTSEQIVTSTDAITWTNRTVPSSQVYSDVIWSGSEFIATSSIATGFGVARSIDGITWESVSAATVSINAIGSDGTQLIAVGDAGAISTSINGQANSWILRRNDLVIGGFVFSDIVWDGDRFIAAAGARVYASADGELWQDLGVANNTGIIDVVASNGATILVVSKPVSGGAPVFSASVDNGQTWTDSVTNVFDSSRLQVRDVIWTGTTFVAVGGRFDAFNINRLDEYFATSSDGIVWEETVLDANSNQNIDAPGGGGGFNAIASNGSRLVAVGRTIRTLENNVLVNAGLIMTSDDGGQSFQLALPTLSVRNGSGYADIEWDGNQFVLIEEDDLGSLKTIWTSATANENSWMPNEIAFTGAGEFADISIANSNNDLLILDAGSVNGRQAYLSNGGLIWGGAETIPETARTNVDFNGIPIEFIASNGTRNVGVFGTQIIKTDCYAPNNISQAELVSPAPNTTLDSSSTTFMWNANGNTPTNWILNFGSSLGANDLGTTGLINGTATSIAVNNLPTDGQTIFVRLLQDNGGEQIVQDDEIYTAQFIQTASITTPSSGSIIDDNSETFVWDPSGVIPDSWVVWVGTSQGNNNIFISSNLSADTTSITINNLPADGSQIWVRLFAVNAGVSSVQDDVNYSNAVPTSAQILTPVPGSILSSNTPTFTWNLTGFGPNDAPRVRAFNAQGAVADSLTLPVGTTSHTFNDSNNLFPTNGEIVTVRLEKLSTVALETVDSEQFVAFNATPAVITSPAEGQQLQDTSVQIVWDAAGVSPDNWLITVGSSLGANDILDSGQIAADATNFIANNLPNDGRDLYFRLLSVSSGVQSVQDEKIYTAIQPSGPQITSPASSITLVSGSINVVWNPQGTIPTNWSVGVGDEGVGTFNLASSGVLNAGETNTTINDLPTDGRTMTVSLFAQQDGVFNVVDSVNITAFNAPTPEITSPTAAAVLLDDTVLVSWNSMGMVTQAWAVGVGDGGVGTFNLGSSGVLDSSTLSANILELPTDGRAMTVSLFAQQDGVFSVVDSVNVTAFNQPTPNIVSPTEGEVLVDVERKIEVSWDAMGLEFEAWAVGVGDGGAGTFNLGSSGVLPENSTDATIDNIPADGRAMTISLFALQNGVFTLVSSVSVTAYSAPPPEIAAYDFSGVGFPLNVSWNIGPTSPEAWSVGVGDDGTGSFNLGSSGVLESSIQNATIFGLPTDGRAITVSLFAKQDGVFNLVDSIDINAFTAPPLAPPEITSPAVNAVLNDDDVTVTWNQMNTVADGWAVGVGDSGAGSFNLGSSGVLPSFAIDASILDLPTDGRLMTVSLFAKQNGIFEVVDSINITAFTTPPAATPDILSPSPNEVLTDASVFVLWDQMNTVAEAWAVGVGDGGVGTFNLGSSGVLASNRIGVDISGLPTDGRAMTVSLFAKQNGVFNVVDSINVTAFTAPLPSAPEIVAPIEPFTLSDSTVYLQWNPMDMLAEAWAVGVGDGGVGTFNLGSSGVLESSAVDGLVFGLPTDGRLLTVSLFAKQNGVFDVVDSINVTAFTSP